MVAPKLAAVVSTQELTRAHLYRGSQGRQGSSNPQIQPSLKRHIEAKERLESSVSAARHVCTRCSQLRWCWAGRRRVWRAGSSWSRNSFCCCPGVISIVCSCSPVHTKPQPDCKSSDSIVWFQNLPPVPRARAVAHDLVRELLRAGALLIQRDGSLSREAMTLLEHINLCKAWPLGK